MGIFNRKKKQKAEAASLGFGVVEDSSVLPNTITLREYIRSELDMNAFFVIIAQVNEAVKNTETNKLPTANLVMDLDNVFVNENNKELIITYQPNAKRNTDPLRFVNDIVFTAVFRMEQDMQYVSSFITFLRQMPTYSWQTMEQYLNNNHPETFAMLPSNQAEAAAPAAPSWQQYTPEQPSVQAPDFVPSAAPASPFNQAQGVIPQTPFNVVQEPAAPTPAWGAQQPAFDPQAIFTPPVAEPIAPVVPQPDFAAPPVQNDFAVPQVQFTPDTADTQLQFAPTPEPVFETLEEPYTVPVAEAPSEPIQTIETIESPDIIEEAQPEFDELPDFRSEAVTQIFTGINGVFEASDFSAQPSFIVPEIAPIPAQAEPVIEELPFEEPVIEPIPELVIPEPEPEPVVQEELPVAEPVAELAPVEEPAPEPEEAAAEVTSALFQTPDDFILAVLQANEEVHAQFAVLPTIEEPAPVAEPEPLPEPEPVWAGPKSAVLDGLEFAGVAADNGVSLYLEEAVPFVSAPVSQPIIFEKAAEEPEAIEVVSEYAGTTVLSEEEEYPNDFSSGYTEVLFGAPTGQLDIKFPTLMRMRTGEIISVDKPVFRIGKEKSYVDYFVTDNNAISRSHADILSRSGKYFILDNNSTNKTYINGTVIPIMKEVEILDGTVLKLANEEFKFKL
ncbi:MAG: FHA domain-containing protein [Oscillospiraceae bacterium]|nr:FHA domain-containing protein [Oscillospiraceae bacterium]